MKVPKLRFPEFSGEWVEKRLGEIFIIKRGASPRPIQAYLSKTGVDWIKIGDVKTDSKYITKTQEKITLSGAKKSVRVYPNDFILSNSMSFGRPYISKIEGCIHDGWLLLRKKVDDINLEYLYYTLWTSKIQKKFTVVAAGSTVNNLKADNVKKIKLHLPPTLEEQQKIASFLSAIDEKIEIVSKRIEKLKEYKKGLLQKLLSVKNGEPELRFPQFSGKWVERRLGEVCDSFSGGTPSRDRKEYFKGNIPFIKSGEISEEETEEKITEEAFKNSSAKLVKKGDLLVALYGATSGEVAISKIDGAINQAVLCLRCETNEKFLLYWFELNKERIRKKYTQGGQPNLSANIIKSLKLHLPPTLQEQEKIASFLSDIDKKIEINQQKLTKLQEYKKGLLQKMFI